MELRPGMYLQGDKYRIIKVLGNGGFGITYLAEHELAGRNVCIKEFFPKEYYNRTSDSHNVSLGSQGSAEMMDAYKAKFIKEAKTIARLDHPNIIHIHDVFAENNTAYYVMEYIEGESLSDVVRKGGALKEEEAVEYIRIIASAIGYIHEQRIMHLDIKPANIMLRKRDNRAILIDFGLSKQYDGDGHQTSSTPVGISAGYAPMEQYQQGGVKEFSPETDIYSLGATLYTLVTGAIPPQAAIIADEGFPELPSHLSAGVRRAIETSMLIQRRRRPHSVEEFLALLDNNVAAAPIPGDGEATILPPQQPLTPPSEDTIITPPVKEQPKVEPRKAEQPKPTPTPTDPKKRSKWWLWLLLLLVAVGGFVGYMMSGGGEPEPTPTPTYEPIPETVVEAEAVIEEQSEVTIAPAEPVVNEPVVNEPAPTPAPTFTLAKSSLTVDSSGGSHSVGYTIEHPINGASVSVSDNQSWITNLSASGGKITFKTTSNTSTESRSGIITVDYGTKSYSITVKQAARPAPTFTLAKSSLTVDSSGGSHSVGYTIENPIDGESVSVSDNYSWITNLSASGGTITFKTTSNTSTESRSGTITATYNGITRQISITQDKGVRTYSIGDYYNENGKRGVVFEVWDGGRHGKIVSLDETKALWDSRVKYDYGKEVYTNGTRTYADRESDGKANTDKIMARSDSQYFDAFKWCRAKGSSWYLPAKDELKQIYNNKDKLNSTLSQYGTAIRNNTHWSSTEYVDRKPEFCAWFVNMSRGFTDYDYKDFDYYVRAVSAF